LKKLDGDGGPELAVGAPGDGLKGAVHVVSLDPSSVTGLNSAAPSVKKVVTLADGLNGSPALLNNGQFGSCVANIGDLDGDGRDDLLVGAMADGRYGQGRGNVHVLLMNADSTVKSYVLLDNAAGVPLVNSDYFGASCAAVAAGTVAVGAEQDDTTGLNMGAVYILSLHQNGTLAAPPLKYTGFSAESTAYCGSAIAPLGSLDANPGPELLVGCRNAGEVYTLFLNPDFTVSSTKKVNVFYLDKYSFLGNALAVLGTPSSGFGRKIAVGFSGNDDGATNLGAVLVFDLGIDGDRSGSLYKISNTTQSGFDLPHR
jgi:FG-GAP repeat